MRNQQDFRKTGTNIIGSNQTIASLTAENNKLLSQLNQKKNLLRDLEKRRKRLEREASKLREKVNQPCPKLNFQMNPFDTVDPIFPQPLNDNFFTDFFGFGGFPRGNRAPLIQNRPPLIPNRPPLIPNRPRGVIGLEDYGEYVPDEEDDLNEIERQMIQEVSPNPDAMSYEQLLELEDKLGSVSKGLSKDKIRVSIKYLFIL